MSSGRVTIVSIAGRRTEAQAAEFIRLVAAGLPAGLELAVIESPRAIDLPDGHELFGTLADEPGDIVLLAELYPRASYWWLYRQGVFGRGCLYDSGGTVQRLDPPADGPGELHRRRTIHCVDLRHCESAAATAKRLAEAIAAVRQAERLASGEAAARQLETVRFEPPQRSRWYPVIDYSRCTQCLDCLEFCLFGVYDADDRERVQVVEPDSCRDGCPACSRVCPELAIIFPKHRSPAVSGGDSDGRAAERIDLSDLLGGPLARQQAEVERARHRAASAGGAADAAAEQAGEASQPGRSSHSPSAQPDELDKLIDAVEEEEL